ncbi:MAG: 50S ribosomal protein L1 [bacterium]
MTKGKRYQAAKKLVDKNKTYSLAEAVDLIKQTSNVKFDASVEIHLRLGIDPKKGDQQIRGNITLPHGTGKTKKVMVFTKNAKEAKEAGADIVGGEDLIKEIKTTGKIDADIIIATPDMMKDLAPIAKILGPKGLMPSPKSETVTANVKQTVEQIKKGRVTFKNDDTSNLHQLIGKISFTNEQLLENLAAFLEAVKKSKPATSKGAFIKNASLCSTLGPGIKIQV